MSDYLVHSKGWKNHKYTRKSYIHGKWRYYYGYDKNTKNPITRFSDKFGFDDRMNAIASKKDYDLEKDYHDYMGSYLNNPKYQSPNVQTFVKRSMKDHEPALKYTKVRAENFAKKYSNTPLGKLEKAVTKGKQTINKIFSKFKK